MKYGSVCSGVEAASLAWMPLDWECKFVAEIEPFPCAVLQQRFGASAPINVLDPNENGISEADRKMRLSWIKQYNQLNKEGVIPNEGDFTKIGKKYAGEIDLLVGGTPCQDLSVAGKRAGFDGERSSLAIDFVRLAYESQCKWFIWENVPGVFSSNKGRDFARLLSLFTGRDVQVPKDGFKSAGFVRNARRDRYGVAWRVLDAQFTRVPGFPFGVPQRRRRVFVVGYFGDWVRAAQVLLEPNRMSWNTPSRFKARESIAGFTGQDFALASGELCNSATDSEELLEQGGVKGFDCYNQNLTDDVSMTVTSKRADPHHVPCAVQALRMRAGKDGGGKGALIQTELSGTLQTGNDQAIATFWNGRDVAETLTAKGADDRMPDKNRLPCVIEKQDTICLKYLQSEKSQKPWSVECAQSVSAGCHDLSAMTKTLDTYHLNSAEDGSCLTLKARDYKDPQIVCLNDQGGSVMAVEENGNAGTLRANAHGNEQIVCAAFAGRQGSAAQGIAYSETHSPTLRAGGEVDLLETLCYENHANDSRVKEMGESCQTLNSRMGTGGGNLPLVQEYYNWHSQNVRADKIEDDCSPTIPAAMGMGGASMTTPMFINECYAIDSLSSNSMKSSNPHSGFHKEEFAKTLDTTNQDATKNQGGNVIVDAVAIAENIIGRAVENGGNGVGAQEELAYTQNASGVMGVCSKGNGDAFESDVHTSLSASGGGQAGQGYPCARVNSTVRRLIPVECERLMGFPDNHTRIAWNGKSPEDCPDAPRYKACGNSMCVNVMRWIGMQIDRVDKMEKEND